MGGQMNPFQIAGEWDSLAESNISLWMRLGRRL
jgi:hypothetical protein